MKTILLIEDNLDIRENACELLELEGYKVIVAEHGRTGLAMAREKNPHIILCDIMMPEMNGYEVLTELKKDADTASIPFIFVTASVEKSEMLIGMNLGADGYVRKPFDEKELLDAITHCLSGE